MTRPEGRAFIPPRPAEVGRVPETRSAPRPLPVDPMGAAALANAAGTPTSARRGFNRLFSAVTGISGRGRPETPVGAKPEPHLSTPAPRQTTPQPRLGGLETPTPQTAAAGQQDLLDIPAFLRRQAN
jgi:cell division protein FtsZ